jgi:signal transduction histidine kinase
MMPKMRIFHKGLLLVAIPLCAGIVFILFLFQGLLQCNSLIERELLLKDSVISYIRSTSCRVAYDIYDNFYRLTRDVSFKQLGKHAIKDSNQANAHLRRLLKNEPELRVPDPYMESVYLLNAEPGKSSPFLVQLQQRADEQSKDALSSVSSFYTILACGLAACIFVSLILAVFFCLNITSRLLLIIQNTRRLSSGANLNPPIKGSDEIAELDQFLYQSSIKIQELERFKKEMIGVVSSELKTPLSSISQFLGSLSKGSFGNLSDKGRNRAERTHSNTRRLMELVEDLLYLDRLELQLKPESVDVSEIVAASVDTVRELADKSAVKIEVKDNGGKVFVDRNRLVQVLVNFLSNAIKFSPREEIVTLNVALRDDFLECRVSDRGKGIPEEARKLIFEPFQQVDSKDAVAKKGTGLGLTISRSIIEQHGGMIGVDSELGKGSTFWFKVPVAARNKVDDSAHDMSSHTESLSHSSEPSTAKFGVLQQGLLIISVPVIFQIVFACIIGFMFNNLQIQIHKEEKSKEILRAVNHTTDEVIGSSKFGVVYVLFREKGFYDVWLHYMNAASNSLNRCLELTTKDKKEQDLLKRNQAFLEEIKKRTEIESQSKANYDFVKEFGSLRRLGTALPPWAKNILDKAGNEQDDQEVEPLSPPEMMSLLQHTANNESYRDFVAPYAKVQAVQEKIMDREKLKGDVLTKERRNMINSLELTLYAGIILSIILSTGLSIFLLRSIRSRLQHIMENTACLVKREPLQAPCKGSDEIAFLDKALFAAGTRLIELENFKKELVSIVSHELRTPLLSVSSALELFDNAVLGELSAEGKKELSQAQSETTRLIRLINDLLDIEKMEAGKFVLDLTDVSVSELIDFAKQTAESRASKKKVVLELSVKNSTNKILHVDKERICQVLVNLIANAIERSPVNSIVKLQVSEINSEKNAEIKFTVMDQGAAVSEELREKIFEKFAQVENLDTAETGGKDLGLAIAKAIVEQHSGTIGADSVVGTGNSFWFCLPFSS